MLHPPVLEQSQCFMSPDSYQSFYSQRLQGPQRFKDASYPPGHFSRGIDVVRLDVLGEAFLYKNIIEVQISQNTCDLLLARHRRCQNSVSVPYRTVQYFQVAHLDTCMFRRFKSSPIKTEITPEAASQGIKI